MTRCQGSLTIKNGHLGKYTDIFFILFNILLQFSNNFRKAIRIVRRIILIVQSECISVIINRPVIHIEVKIFMGLEFLSESTKIFISSYFQLSITAEFILISLISFFFLFTYVENVK